MFGTALNEMVLFSPRTASMGFFWGTGTLEKQPRECAKVSNFFREPVFKTDRALTENTTI